ncbi:GDP dissociation inhibitor [Babesia microti strain RI]|uniref:GDP dissociation inhibitor n=1 Tax=Babesia microti (strain RI) TaxID=1133968 RepID=A0A0K3ASZ2_BABMR|nr:GDP dissociation inhibitor [Babesia microti strain RI]CTQ40671.1 GDP dissociation inhibitor [Babesia microti strain RI]|eukprot:XP_012648682.1 GDP dissociation inhibitor [Babesia microti strain RI]
MVEKLEADVVIYGTGLVSILTAVGLSFQGVKVILLDPNPDYGSNYRTLNLKNYITQILNGIEITHDTPDNHPSDTNNDKRTPTFASKDANANFVFNPFEHYNNELELCQIEDNINGSLQYSDNKTLSEFKYYHIDLWPKMLYGNSPAVTSLLAAGCDNYVQFTAVEGSYIYRNGHFAQLPGSKSAIFRSGDFTLLQKRNLCRFLRTTESFSNFKATKDLETSETNPISVNDIIQYGLCRVHYKDKPHNLLDRAKMYISSIGIYGRHHSPFIYPLYGTCDIVQALARAASLAGTVCMLRSVISKAQFNTVITSDDGYENETCNRFDLCLTIDTHGMTENELDLTVSEINCNFLITESHLQHIPYTCDNDTVLTGIISGYADQSDNKHQFVIPALNAHIAIFISNEKLLEEGVSTSVILNNDQSYLLQLDASSGTVPQGYYIYYMMGIITQCNGGVIECPHMINIRELFEKNKKHLSSILFASHHNSISKSADECQNYMSNNIVDECYNCGMMMTFVDEIPMAIDTIRKVKNALSARKFTTQHFKMYGSDNVIAVGDKTMCKDYIGSENEYTNEFIFHDTFGNKKKKSLVLDRLTALVEEFEEYTIDNNVDKSIQYDDGDHSKIIQFV